MLFICFQETPIGVSVFFSDKKKKKKQTHKTKPKIITSFHIHQRGVEPRIITKVTRKKQV